LDSLIKSFIATQKQKSFEEGKIFQKEIIKEKVKKMRLFVGNYGKSGNNIWQEILNFLNQ